MTPELERVSKDEIYHLIDHCWMVANPDHDEYAFLFRLIQERHRTKFMQACETSTQSKTSIDVAFLQEMDAERERAEEILYWLYRDAQLRKDGKTLPDEWEADALAEEP